MQNHNIYTYRDGEVLTFTVLKLHYLKKGKPGINVGGKDHPA